MHVPDEACEPDVPRYLQPFEGRGALRLILIGNVVVSLYISVVESSV